MYLRIHILVCYYMYVQYGYGVCMHLCFVYAYVCWHPIASVVCTQYKYVFCVCVCCMWFVYVYKPVRGEGKYLRICISVYVAAYT